MADNKSKQGKQDDIRVDANDLSEVEYLHKQFPNLTHQKNKAAIRSKGPLRADIITCLKKQ